MIRRAAWRPDRGRAHRDPAHRLDPCGDDDVLGAGHDRLSGEVDRLLARTALAVDGRGRDPLGVAGGEHGASPDVERLFGDLGDVAGDDVVDHLRIEAVALDDGAQGVGEEFDGVGTRQDPSCLAAPEGCPHRIDDHCICHDVSPFSTQ
jgi:hypothetical protein